MARIHQLVDRQYSRLLKAAGNTELGPSQARILYSMWHSDGIPIAELCKRTSLSKSTLTTMLDKLEEADFIQRMDDVKDRRSTIIKITAKEKSVRRRYATVSKDMAEIFYRNFSETEIDRFERSLARILENLENFE